MNIITLHTVPSSVHDRLAQDTIVSRLQPNGRFTDTYVGDLVEGDQFFVPEKELPPRDGDDILNWIGKNQVEWEFDKGFPHLDPEEPHKVIITVRGLQELVRHEYVDDDHAGALRDALEFAMDQEEL